MAITAVQPSRAIIVGAGASLPYGLPLASNLLEDSVNTIARLKARANQGIKEHYLINESYLCSGNEIDLAAVRAMGGVDELNKIYTAFRDQLVAQNLDDFVRDHPSLTNIVSMLIAISLFRKIYTEGQGNWKLRSAFNKGGLSPGKDWMRSLVGVVRPMASTDKKLAIVSFNYDGLLERSMRLYWPGSEIKYPALSECVEFIYPHGKLTELPDSVFSPAAYLSQQVSNIRLGENKDETARTRAKEIIAQSTRIFAVGFSFSANNLDLLGIDRSNLSARFFVQNYENTDKRLSRILDDAGVSPNHRDDGDMDSLIRHGFFER